MLNLEKVNGLIYQNIPISKEIGISIERFDNSGLLLKAPIMNNINHNHTAFGGSLNAVAVLSCWIFLFLFFKKYDNSHPQILLQKSSINFLHPISSDFYAICHWPNKQSLDHFLKVYRTKRKARIELSSEIFSTFESEVLFSGSFVVINSTYS
jgi:thioesterase domain-containing protein